MDVIVESLLTAVGTPRRREILRLLWQVERRAGEVHRALGDVTFGAVSQHLRVLERAGALVVRRDGRRRIYAARREALGALAPWLEAMWSDALYALKLRAELEGARRGPRSAGTARRLGTATARRLGQASTRRRSRKAGGRRSTAAVRRSKEAAPPSRPPASPVHEPPSYASPSRPGSRRSARSPSRRTSAGPVSRSTMPTRSNEEEP